MTQPYDALLADLEIRGADFEREARAWSFQMKAEARDLRRRLWRTRFDMRNTHQSPQDQAETADLIASARRAVAASKLIIAAADRVLAAI